jgi:hypothetical protein
MVLTMGSACALGIQALSVMRMGREQASASQVLQQRVEQLRVANWVRVTDETWLRDNLLNQDPPGIADLASPSETVIITPYGSATTSKNTFTRKNGQGTAGTNVSLKAESCISVTWRIAWSGTPRSKSNTREAVVILGKGGVAK